MRNPQTLNPRCFRLPAYRQQEFKAPKLLEMFYEKMVQETFRKLLAIRALFFPYNEGERNRRYKDVKAVKKILEELQEQTKAHRVWIISGEDEFSPHGRFSIDFEVVKDLFEIKHCFQGIPTKFYAKEFKEGFKKDYIKVNTTSPVFFKFNPVPHVARGAKSFHCHYIRKDGKVRLSIGCDWKREWMVNAKREQALRSVVKKIEEYVI